MFSFTHFDSFCDSYHNHIISFYSHIRAYPTCCWWVWACGRPPAWTSSGPRWTGCPGGCTSAGASPGRPGPPPSTTIGWTCSAGRPRPRCPSGGCTWSRGPTRGRALWTVETFFWNRILSRGQKIRSKINLWLHLDIYIRAFSRRFYPKRLTISTFVKLS